MFTLLTKKIIMRILFKNRSKFLLRKKIATRCKITKRWSFSLTKLQKLTQNIIKTSKLLKNKLLYQSVEEELSAWMEWASAVHNSLHQSQAAKTLKMSPKRCNLTQKSAFWMIVPVWEVLGPNLTWQLLSVLSDRTNVFWTKLARQIL